MAILISKWPYEQGAQFCLLNVYTLIVTVANPLGLRTGVIKEEHLWSTMIPHAMDCEKTANRNQQNQKWSFARKAVHNMLWCRQSSGRGTQMVRRCTSLTWLKAARSPAQQCQGYLGSTIACNCSSSNSLAFLLSLSLSFFFSDEWWWIITRHIIACNLLPCLKISAAHCHCTS